ncbi:MAG: hypothetical protein JWM48_388 [Mycobacterium sp.]|nr:hypothetical protein [Mycobacterium sp.]
MWMNELMHRQVMGGAGKGPMVGRSLGETGDLAIGGCQHIVAISVQRVDGATSTVSRSLNAAARAVDPAARRVDQRSASRAPGAEWKRPRAGRNPRSAAP